MKKTLNLFLAAGMLCACAEPVHLDSGDELILDSWTLSQEGSNVAREIMWNTIQFYGYQSFEDAMK